MKITLAIVLAVTLFSGVGSAGAAPTAAVGPSENPGPDQATSPQQIEPAAPCAKSSDTCVAAPDSQNPSSSPSSPPEKKPIISQETPKKGSPTKKHKAHVKKGKKESDTVASSPKKTVVRDGGTSDPAVVLTPGTQSQPGNSRQLTEDLLSATDANLKQANSHPLNPDQEQTVSQIKVFVEQANAAIKAGDLDRGHNLAIKARLLSDDLVKH